MLRFYVRAEGLSEEMIEGIDFIGSLAGLFMHKELKD